MFIGNEKIREPFSTIENSLHFGEFFPLIFFYDLSLIFDEIFEAKLDFLL